MVAEGKVVDIFGFEIKPGDIILRQGGGDTLLPCVVVKITHNKLGRPLKIFTEHPYKDGYWQKRSLNPFAEVARVNNYLVAWYVGHRQGWYGGFVDDLLNRQEEIRNG